MVKDKLLSLTDLARELNFEKATTRFLLKRFKKIFPGTMLNGQSFYSHKVIQTLFIIQEKFEMGILPSLIEDELAHAKTDEDLFKQNGPVDDDLTVLSNNKNNQSRNNDLATLQSVFKEIGEKQKQIADANEQRVAAEKNNALAMEKLTDTEEKKAVAMNTIAAALREMNRPWRIDPNAQKGYTFVSSDKNKTGQTVELDDLRLLIDQCSDDQNFIKAVDPDDSQPLVNDRETITEKMDDLSALPQDTSAAEDPKAPVSDVPPPTPPTGETDDASDSIRSNADHPTDTEPLTEKSDSLADEISLRVRELPEELKLELINTIRAWQKGKSRKFNRKNLTPQIDIMIGDRVLQTNMKNISASGVLIQTREKIETDKNVKMVFSLPGKEKPLKLDGRVVRNTENGVAVEFKEVSPYFTDILDEAIWSD